MRERGAPPPLIEAAAQDYLDHFPYTLADLPANPDALEDAVHVLIDIRSARAPLQAACVRTARINEAEGAYAALREFPSHDDGGRCARHIYELLLRFAAASKDARDIDMFFRAFDGSFDGPIVELASLHLTRELRRCGWTPTDAFVQRSLERKPAMPRFVALQTAAIHWLERTHEPERFEEAARALDSPLSTVTMRVIAGELIAFNAAIEAYAHTDPPYGPPPARLLNAGRRVVRACPGTFLASASWHRLIEACAYKRQPAAGEAELDEWVRDHGTPDFGSEALWILAGLEEEGRTPEETRRLIDRALAEYPDGIAIPNVLVLLAELHRDAGREAEMIRTLEGILRRPREAQPQAQRFRVDSAQAHAHRMLGDYYERKKEWKRALEHWGLWEPGGSCVTCIDGMGRMQAYHLGVCREALGEVDEAVRLYWAVSGGADDDAYDAARRLKSIYKSRGKGKEFREAAAAKVAELRAQGWGLIESSGIWRIGSEEK